ncbi:nitroreductase family deazaflavin-dependent oxidoreductase [Actinomadura sp. BRA 177]|nr:nitroreductase family deazaflavin-dependent oxidoreductase [Actinomadura sp. BRA 177]
MDFNTQVIEEFRANGGRVGGPFEGGRLLLLTTTGARSGAPHTTPLGYLPDGLERVLVIASAGGAPKNPAWFHNLVANPRVTVESGAFTYEADAVVLEGDERDAAFARAVEADPGWGEYEAKSGRTLPVIALVQVMAGPPGGPGSMGAMLVAVHDAFRSELALIRREVAASGAGVGAQLRVNCLTLCQGLGNHHMGEDQQLFPLVGRHHPERGRGPPGRHTTPPPNPPGAPPRDRLRVRPPRPVRRDRPRRPRIRPDAPTRRPADRIRAGRPRRHLHPPPPQRLRHTTFGRTHVGRRTTANGPGPSLRTRRPHPHPGRRHLQPRHRHRSRDHRRRPDPLRRPNPPDHRPPSLHRRPHGPGRLAGKRPPPRPGPPHDPLDQPRLPRHLHRPRKGRAPSR